MKLLVLLAVLGVVYLMWRAERRAEQAQAQAPAPGPSPQRPALPQAMVACSICAVHVPREDALFDPAGRVYCSAEHRRQSPG